VLALEPAHANANMAVGAHLLGHDDEAGLEHLERACDADPLARPYAAELAYAFEAARGREQEAARHRSTVNAHLDELNAAGEERRGLTRKDRLEPHGLPPEAVLELCEQLRANDRVARAYLARKGVRHLADEAPLFVLGIVPNTKWWRLEGGRDDERMIDRVLEEVDLPSAVLAVPLISENKWLRKRLEGVGGSRVFAR
jgi:hypothetical protein